MYRNIYCDPDTLYHRFGNFDFDTIEKAKEAGKLATSSRWVKTVELPDNYPKVLNLTEGVFRFKWKTINNYDLPCDFTR